MVSGGGDPDRSASAVLDLAPRKSVRIGLRCGGVGGGRCVDLSRVAAGLTESSAIVGSLMCR